MSVDYVSKDSCQKKQIAVKFFTLSPIRRADDYAPYIKCFQILWPISWRASGFNAQYVARFLTWQKMPYFFTLNLLRNDLGNISLQCKDTPILECSKRLPIKYVSIFSEIFGITLPNAVVPVGTCGSGDVTTPIFGSHLNPIPIRGGRLCPPYTVVPTKFWKPQARLFNVSNIGISIPPD